MDLLALTDFNLVARHGGFGRAARAAGRPKATLSRRVAELEAALGTRLVERGVRVLKLTEDGRLLHERTSGLLAEIDEVGQAVAGGSLHPRGTLRLSIPVLFAHTAMGRLAAGFAARYPDVRLEVTAEDRDVDLIEEGYDLIMRANPRPTDDLVGRCFMRDRLVVVAAPGFARPHGDATVRAVILGPADASRPWRVALDGRPSMLTPDPAVRLSSMLMVRDAVVAGAGAGLLPVSLIGDDIAQGRLVAWGPLQAPEVAVWILHASRRLPGAKVTAFLDYLVNAFPTGAPEEVAAFMRHGYPGVDTSGHRSRKL